MIKIGQGFDLHKLVEGRDLIIGGVCIPHEKGLFGHSDADVLIHAIVDAIIGALGIGDIGVLFPDTDSSYSGINSRNFLRKMNALLTEYGFVIGNIDATVIIEKPKLRHYIDLMRENIANDLGITVSQVNVKAKTSEGVGIIGHGEAAVAQAVVLIER